MRSLVCMVAARDETSFCTAEAMESWNNWMDFTIAQVVPHFKQGLGDEEIPAPLLL